MLERGAGEVVEIALEHEVLEPGRVVVGAELLADHPDRAADPHRVGLTSNPATRAVPESGRDRVVRTLTVVDLPAPLGPEQAEDRARLDGEVEAVERPDAPG